ncbi:Hypothetical protein FKW44_021917, partial [Caligus rogercresseyi]
MDNKDNEKDSLKLLLDEHFPESIENDQLAVHSNQACKSQEPLEDYFSAESVKSAIKSLKSNKKPGLIKYLPKHINMYLTT